MSEIIPFHYTTEGKRLIYDLVGVGYPVWMISLLFGLHVSTLHRAIDKHGLKQGHYFRKCMTCPEWFGSSDRKRIHRCDNCQKKPEGLI